MIFFSSQAGRWRSWGLLGVSALVLLPALPLFVKALGTSESLSAGYGFFGALTNSLHVAFAVGGVSLILGLPLGVSVALYVFPCRSLLQAILTLPLLVPSFLWAIGWSALLATVGPEATAFLSGATGCILVFLAGSVPLVFWTCFAATKNLSDSQVQAARLAGGEPTVLRYAVRNAAIPGALIATLVGILTLADPGPGLILGLRTAASEILTSFSARYDFNLAGRQCVYLTLVVLAFALPLSWLAAPRLAAEIMARQVRAAQAIWHRRSAWLLVVSLAMVGLVFVAAPTLGLCLPLRQGGHWSRAWQEVQRTWWDTLLYAVGAGLVAVLLGFLAGFFVGKRQRLRVACLGMALAVFSLPPAQSSLGIIQLATDSPAWADVFLRSRFTVCFALGVRFFPIAVVLGMRAWNSVSPSWTEAAQLHGVPPGLFFGKVLAPFLAPYAAIAGLLVALLATAEIGTVLLLHPPGHTSFPLAIFTVMANAPERLVATLCFLYLILATVLLSLTFVLLRRGDR